MKHKYVQRISAIMLASSMLVSSVPVSALAEAPAVEGQAAETLVGVENADVPNEADTWPETIVDADAAAEQTAPAEDAASDAVTDTAADSSEVAADDATAEAVEAAEGAADAETAAEQESQDAAAQTTADAETVSGDETTEDTAAATEAQEESESAAAVEMADENATESQQTTTTKNTSGDAPVPYHTLEAVEGETDKDGYQKFKTSQEGVYCYIDTRALTYYSDNITVDETDNPYGIVIAPLFPEVPAYQQNGITNSGPLSYDRYAVKSVTIKFELSEDLPDVKDGSSFKLPISDAIMQALATAQNLAEADQDPNATTTASPVVRVDAGYATEYIFEVIQPSGQKHTYKYVDGSLRITTPDYSEGSELSTEASNETKEVSAKDDYGNTLPYKYSPSITHEAIYNSPLSKLLVQDEEIIDVASIFDQLVNLSNTLEEQGTSISEYLVNEFNKEAAANGYDITLTSLDDLIEIAPDVVSFFGINGCNATDKSGYNRIQTFEILIYTEAELNTFKEKYDAEIKSGQVEVLEVDLSDSPYTHVARIRWDDEELVRVSYEQYYKNILQLTFPVVSESFKKILNSLDQDAIDDLNYLYGYVFEKENGGNSGPYSVDNLSDEDLVKFMQMIFADSLWFNYNDDTHHNNPELKHYFLPAIGSTLDTLYYLYYNAYDNGDKDHQKILDNIKMTMYDLYKTDHGVLDYKGDTPLWIDADAYIQDQLKNLKDYQAAGAETSPFTAAFSMLMGLSTQFYEQHYEDNYGMLFGMDLELKQVDGEITVNSIDQNKSHITASKSGYNLYYITAEDGNDKTWYYALDENGEMYFTDDASKAAVLMTTDGKLNVQYLMPREYFLEEVVTPDGYILETKAMKFAISEGMESTVDFEHTVETEAPQTEVETETETEEEEEPVEKSKSVKTASAAIVVDVPKTADNTPLLLWSVTALLSAAAWLALGIYRKKENAA